MSEQCNPDQGFSNDIRMQTMGRQANMLVDSARYDDQQVLSTCKRIRSKSDATYSPQLASQLASQSVSHNPSLAVQAQAMVHTMASSPGALACCFSQRHAGNSWPSGDDWGCCEYSLVLQVQAHEGWILQIEDTYLWYGSSNKHSSTTPAGDEGWISDSVVLYVSHDLSSWHRKATVFSTAAMPGAVKQKLLGEDSNDAIRCACHGRHADAGCASFTSSATCHMSCYCCHMV
jgi:hypothetical protein